MCVVRESPILCSSYPDLLAVGSSILWSALVRQFTSWECPGLTEHGVSLELHNVSLRWRCLLQSIQVMSDIVVLVQANKVASVVLDLTLCSVPVMVLLVQ